MDTDHEMVEIDQEGFLRDFLIENADVDDEIVQQIELVFRGFDERGFQLVLVIGEYLTLQEDLVGNVEFAASSAVIRFVVAESQLDDVRHEDVVDLNPARESGFVLVRNRALLLIAERGRRRVVVERGRAKLVRFVVVVKQAESDGQFEGLIGNSG